MSQQEFDVFMSEMALVMEQNRTYPADEKMYLAMRAWLFKKLVRCAK